MSKSIKSLWELARGAGCELPAEPPLDVEIEGVSIDTRQLKKNDLFIALKGSKIDAKTLKDEALRAGAAAVIDHTILGSHARRFAAIIARAFLPPRAKNLKWIGITGTSGKTSTTFLIQHLLTRLGASPLLVGTIGNRFQEETIPTDNTTPDPCTLFGLVARYLPRGLTHVVMEVSSHALAEERVFGIPWSCTGFLNLSREHLDFHDSMEDYFQAKRRLFFDSPHSTRHVICPGDEHNQRLLQELQEAKRDVILAPSVSTEVFSASGLEGEFQKQNLSLALGITEALGLLSDSTHRADLLRDFSGTPGRMEKVANIPRVFVDYAHKPEALKQVLASTRTSTEGKLILVFGCGGNRDRGKRPIMGDIACSLADQVIITTDNSRDEDPLQIVADIKAGLSEVQKQHLTIELDRARAIRTALAVAGPKDTVLITGKGHETYQLIQGVRQPFDDREVIREFLNE